MKYFQLAIHYLIVFIVIKNNMKIPVQILILLCIFIFYTYSNFESFVSKNALFQTSLSFIHVLKRCNRDQF